MSALTEMPESFAAGTTVKYTRSLADYPANAGWTLKVSLAGAGVLTVDATASGADHLVTMSAEQTAALPAGTYRWSEKASKAGETYLAASGQLTIEPNLDAAGAGDLQSSNEKLLAAVDALIAKRLDPCSTGGTPKGIDAYVIDGISITYMSIEELQKLRVSLSYAVQSEKRGGGIGRQHRIAFTGAANE